MKADLEISPKIRKENGEYIAEVEAIGISCRGRTEEEATGILMERVRVYLLDIMVDHGNLN